MFPSYFIWWYCPFTLLSFLLILFFFFLQFAYLSYCVGSWNARVLASQLATRQASQPSCSLVNCILQQEPSEHCAYFKLVNGGTPLSPWRQRINVLFFSVPYCCNVVSHCPTFVEWTASNITFKAKTSTWLSRHKKVIYPSYEKSSYTVVSWRSSVVAWKCGTIGFGFYWTYELVGQQ